MIARGVVLCCLGSSVLLAGCIKVAVVRKPSAALEESTEPVRAAQNARFEAMVSGNIAALDTLLANDLTYVHTGGQIQSKSEFLGTIRTKSLVYESISPSDVRIRMYDGATVATGLSNMKVRTEAGVSNFGIRFTETYVWRDGRWQLVAWQAARRQ